MSDGLKDATEKVVKAYRQIYETTGGESLDIIFRSRGREQYKFDLIVALGNLSREFCAKHGPQSTNSSIEYMVECGRKEESGP